MPLRLYLSMRSLPILQSILKGVATRMGHYLDTIFGNKITAFFAAVASCIITLYMNFVGEMGAEIARLSIAVAILFVGDTILGSMIARDRGVFSSKGFSRVLEKMVVYTLAVVGMTAFGVLVSVLPIASGISVSDQTIDTISRIFFVWTLLLIGLTEFVSVVENLRILGFKFPKNIDRLTQWMSNKLCEITLIPSKDGRNVCGGEECGGTEGGLDSASEKGEDESP